ncbi:MAG: TadE family protein [Terriglobales bacterium]
MPNIKQIARQLRSADGSEIAEAAMVLPLVFMLLLGIIWFGRAFNTYSTIQQAAQQGAIAAARASCATCGGATTFPTNVDTAVSAIMNADKLDTSKIKASSPSPLSCTDTTKTVTCTKSGLNITVCQQALLNSPASSTQSPQCGVVVSFQYPFSFDLLSLTSLGSMKLSAQAQSRMEN